MTSPVSDFAYVGARPYIRGADVLRFCLASLDPAVRPVAVRSLRLTRELERNGVWALGGRAPQGAGEPSATLELALEDGEAYKAGFYETGAVVERREPDIGSAIAGLDATGDFAGSFEVVAPVDFRALLDGLIEANKALHATTLAGRGLDAGNIRFVYAERLPLLGASAARATAVPARFVHRGARVLDGRTYTLNVAEITWADRVEKALFCFSC